MTNYKSVEHKLLSKLAQRGYYRSETDTHELPSVERLLRFGYISEAHSASAQLLINITESGRVRLDEFNDDTKKEGNNMDYDTVMGVLDSIKDENKAIKEDVKELKKRLDCGGKNKLTPERKAEIHGVDVVTRSEMGQFLTLDCDCGHLYFDIASTKELVKFLNESLELLDE